MKNRRKKVLIMYSPGLEQKMVELPIYIYIYINIYIYIYIYIHRVQTLRTSLALCLHPWQKGLDEMEGGRQVDGHHGVPVVIR